MFQSWTLPAAVYILVTGTIGITAKLALRTITWKELLVWTAVAYAVAAVICVAVTNVNMTLNSGAALGLLSGALAASGLVVLFVALSRADVIRVVPVTSAYPVVTLVLSAVILSEHVSALKVLGTLLVVGGVVLVAR
jgi:transporter family protein